MNTDLKYIELLRKMGLKATKLRIALLTHLFETEFPVDVASYSDFLKQQKVPFDQVTVYRNLETFVKEGLAKKVDLQDGKYYYEKASDCSHLVCEQCGKIEHIHMEENHEVEHKIVEKTGFRISQHVSDFFGICRICQNK